MPSWIRLIGAVAVTLSASQASEAANPEIGLQNFMASPVAVQLVSTADGGITDLRLGRHETIRFSFYSDEFDVRVIPLDRSDTVFYLGRLPFKAIAAELGKTPLVLKGQFQPEVCPSGQVHQVRVAVHLDMALSGQLTRLSAPAPGYLLADNRTIVYLIPQMLR